MAKDDRGMTEALNFDKEVEEQLGFDDFVISLGDQMRGERATLGKTLEDVAHDLKIKAKYLDAIENCDASVFETASFVSGFVRSYASYLDLDPQYSFVRFCEESGFDGVKAKLSEDKPSKIKPIVALSPTTKAIMDDPLVNPRVPNRPAKAGWFSFVSPSGVVSSVVLMAMIGGIGYGGYSILQEVQRVQFAPVNETPGVASTVSGLQTETQVAEDSFNQASLTAATQTASLEQLYRPQELEAPKMVARDGPIVSIDPASLGTYTRPEQITLTELAPPVQNAPPQVTEIGPPTVDIVAVNPAWIRVFQKSGGVLFENTLDAGQRYRVPLDIVEPMLRAGNSGSVYLLVGDKTYGPVGVKTGVARKVGLTIEKITEKYQEVDGLFDGPLDKPVNLPVVAEAPVVDP